MLMYRLPEELYPKDLQLELYRLYKRYFKDYTGIQVTFNIDGVITVDVQSEDDDQ